MKLYCHHNHYEVCRRCLCILAPAYIADSRATVDEVALTEVAS